MAYTNRVHWESIRRYLYLYRDEILSDNVYGLTHNNHDAEAFYAELLNKIYGWKLADANRVYLMNLSNLGSHLNHRIPLLV